MYGWVAGYGFCHGKKILGKICYFAYLLIKRVELGGNSAVFASAEIQ